MYEVKLHESLPCVAPNFPTPAESFLRRRYATLRMAACRKAPTLCKSVGSGAIGADRRNEMNWAADARGRKPAKLREPGICGTTSTSSTNWIGSTLERMLAPSNCMSPISSTHVSLWLPASRTVQAWKSAVAMRPQPAEPSEFWMISKPSASSRNQPRSQQLRLHCFGLGNPRERGLGLASKSQAKKHGEIVFAQGQLCPNLRQHGEHRNEFERRRAQAVQSRSKLGSHEAKYGQGRPRIVDVTQMRPGFVQMKGDFDRCWRAASVHLEFAPKCVRSTSLRNEC